MQCNDLAHKDLWSTDTDTDTGHNTDMDTWTPVKHIKFNPDTGVDVVSVSVSCQTPDTARKGSNV